MYDVIVVLGAAQNRDGSPGPAMERRVRHGAQCLKAGKAPYILMSGGCTKTSVPESQTMAEIALQEGVPMHVIVQENHSTRTIENAIECQRVMRERGWSRALLVTDTFHMPRALQSFRALDLDVTPEPNSVPVSLSTALSYSREWVARALYAQIIRRYLTENQ